MTQSRSYTVALLTLLTYGRSICFTTDAEGNEIVAEFDRINVFVPRGEQPKEVRDLNDEEREGFAEAVKDNRAPFAPTKYVEFHRAFLIDQNSQPAMYGAGFGIYVAENDGQPIETREVNDFTLPLAKLLFGRNGDAYEGLDSAMNVELPLSKARFNFAQTLEAIQNSIRHKARAKVAEQQVEMLAWGKELADEMARDYVQATFGEDFTYLFKEGEQAEAREQA